MFVTGRVECMITNYSLTKKIRATLHTMKKFIITLILVYVSQCQAVQNQTWTGKFFAIEYKVGFEPYPVTFLQSVHLYSQFFAYFVFRVTY